MAMAEDVLTVLSSVTELGGVLVVTSDQRAVRLAQRFSAEVCLTLEDYGLNQAVTLAASRLDAEGAEGMLVIPADLPRITVSEIRRLIDGHPSGCSVTIVPDQARHGTNALLLVPPVAIDVRYGPGSFDVHCARARRQGIEPNVMVMAGLAVDVDWPGDVPALTELEPDSACRRVLGEAGRLVEAVGIR